MVVVVRRGDTTSLLSTTTYPVLKLFLCPHIPKPEDDIVLRNDGNRSLRRGPDAHTVLDTHEDSESLLGPLNKI